MDNGSRKQGRLLDSWHSQEAISEPIGSWSPGCSDRMGSLGLVAARWVSASFQFIALLAFLTIISLTFIIAVSVTELRRYRPVRPVIKQLPNRQTKLCKLVVSFFRMVVPSGAKAL